MIPMERLAFKEHRGERYKDSKGDDFLNHFELYQRKGASVFVKPDAVGRDLEAILKESDAPGEQDYGIKWPMCADFHFLKFQVAIPGKSHEYVGNDKEQNGL